ncbi:MAG: site-specific DNA-methyltransferase [Cyanobacteriota bacterium]|nr:site-specific DNA-methyltransferase [Cyanobacteriota bacterium]
MKPDYEGSNWAIYLADCIEIMSGLPEGIIDCAVFSPPFSDLFVYSDSERDMGNCGSHDEFMEHYAYFTQALLRVMKPGRVACVHCSDLPARKSKDGFIGLHDFGGDLIRAHQDAGWVYHARCTIWKDPVIEMQRTKALGLLYKQLKKDSSRSRVGMPDYMLFFRKDQENPDPITHAPEDLPVSMWQELASPVWMTVNQTKVLNGRQAKGQQDEKHICPLQLDVIERCLTLYSNPGDLVLDPFNGIGSTGYQAIKMGRRYIGVELKPEYAKQAAKFLQGAEQQSGSLLDLLPTA